MELTVPLLTWSIIVTIVAIMAIATFVNKHRHHTRGQNIVELGSEREEFFVPGDRIRYDIKDYDIDE